MKKLLISCVWLLSTLGLIHADDFEYICSQPVLSIHQEPQELSEVVSQLIWSDSVQIIERQSDGWVRVITKDDVEGWVHSGGLVEFEDATYPRLNHVASVTSPFAHVYLVRDVTTYPPILTLPYGAKVEVANALDVQADRYCKVRLVAGEVAYMLRSTLTINPQPLSVEEMVTLARQFVGVPYTWGGSSAYGFDAPGLVSFLYRQMGITLPRDVYQISMTKTLTNITLDKARPGDLLFFSQRDDGQVDHIGLYLGNGDFIHTSFKNTPPAVLISSLKTPYWQLSFKKAMSLE